MCQVARREFIRMSALSLLSVYSGAFRYIEQSILCQNARGKDSFAPFNWDEFIAYLSKLAHEQHLKTWNEVSYLKKTQQIISNLNWQELSPVKEAL